MHILIEITRNVGVWTTALPLMPRSLYRGFRPLRLRTCPSANPELGKAALTGKGYGHCSRYTPRSTKDSAQLSGNKPQQRGISKALFLHKSMVEAKGLLDVYIIIADLSHDILPVLS
jgi:hypothetical protein